MLLLLRARHHKNDNDTHRIIRTTHATVLCTIFVSISLIGAAPQHHESLHTFFSLPLASAAPGDPAPGMVSAIGCPGIEGNIPTENSLEQLQRSEKYRHAHAIATGRNVRVAVIDTGVYPHPRLGTVEAGPDFIAATGTPDTQGERDGSLIDCDIHGTVVAGIIGAHEAYPRDQFVGVAPDARIVSIRQTSNFYRTPQAEEADDADTRARNTHIGTLRTLAAAINAAIDAHVRVINMSVVSCIPSRYIATLDIEPMRHALERAEEAGIVVVSAAGNESTTCAKGDYVFPASFDTVLAVGATADARTLATYSLPTISLDSEHHAFKRQLSAEGYSPIVLSARDAGLSGRYIPFAAGQTSEESQPYIGTSFAAPIVAGTAALLFEKNPQATPREIRDLFYASVDPALGTVDPLRTLSFHNPIDAAPDAYTHAASPFQPRPRTQSFVPARALRVLSVVLLAGGLFIVVMRWIITSGTLLPCTIGRFVGKFRTRRKHRNNLPRN